MNIIEKMLLDKFLFGSYYIRDDIVTFLGDLTEDFPKFAFLSIDAMLEF